MKVGRPTTKCLKQPAWRLRLDNFRVQSLLNDSGEELGEYQKEVYEKLYLYLNDIKAKLKYR